MSVTALRDSRPPTSITRPGVASPKRRLPVAEVTVRSPATSAETSRVSPPPFTCESSSAVSWSTVRAPVGPSMVTAPLDAATLTIRSEPLATLTAAPLAPSTVVRSAPVIWSRLMSTRPTGAVTSTVVVAPDELTKLAAVIAPGVGRPPGWRRR